MTDTYKEIVHRYRVIKHEELPEEHKKAYRKHGDNPDDIWKLVWSFKTKEDAIKQLMKDRENALWWETYRFLDAGKDEIIERPVW